MVVFGYELSCKAHAPHSLIRYAQLAEKAGFSFVLLTGSTHPGMPHQEHSPFVWSMIGALAQTTRRLRLGIAMGCAPVPLHPAIVAQAIATAAALWPRRFFLSMETGETRHDYLFGRPYATADKRLAMLEEAIQVMRCVWQGGTRQYWGEYYKVDNVRLTTLPEQAPPILIAAAQTHTARLAGRLGDGLLATAPRQELLAAFRAAGGAHKPRYGKVTVCWNRNKAAADDLARQWWTATVGATAANLALPTSAVQAIARASAGSTTVTCGPDPTHHLAAIRAFVEAGYDHICVEQVGADQEGCLQFYRREILPQLL